VLPALPTNDVNINVRKVRVWAQEREEEGRGEEVRVNVVVAGML